MTGSDRIRPGRILLGSFAGLVCLFLMLPLLVVFPLSVSSADFLQFPPPGLSWRWFAAYLGDAGWLRATGLSIGVGVATALLSTAIGIPAAFFLVRSRARMVAVVVDKILVSPMVIPPVVVAIVAYSLFSQMQAIGSWWVLVLTHSVLALPMVVIVMTAGLREFDPVLAQAAEGLGADRLRTFALIVLPIVRPSVISAMFFAFMTSFDDLIVAVFLAGANVTLPKKMFENISFQLDPTIAAVCVLQILCVLVGGGLWLLWRAALKRKGLQA